MNMYFQWCVSSTGTCQFTPYTPGNAGNDARFG